MISGSVDQKIGDLFIVRNVQPSELNRATVQEIQYWHRWHKIANDYEEKELKKIKNRKG